MIEVGSDFSGVGAFDQALMRLGIDYKKVFACDWDKYARQTYIHNYGAPDYFPMDVYDREIPADPLDIYMTSPPCQAFSLAGKRKGEDDKRGILFYNSHEFIKKNNPRYFIFENVKGLLSDSAGATFGKWIQYLGGKSVNGNTTVFPHDDSVPYHIYWKVLNAKNYNIPQNRERVFIVGIRDDLDNNFTWPKEIFLEKRLRDVLEKDVDEKYFLSDKMAAGLIIQSGKMFINQDTQASQVYNRDDLSPNICAGTHGYAMGYIKEPAEIIKAGQLTGTHESSGRVYSDERLAPTVTAKQGVSQNPKIIQRGRGNNKGGEHDICPTITTNSFEHNNHIKLDTDSGRKSIINGYRIRRLTPRECFRLMDFDDAFTWPVSDTQAYKQAGNSICVGVLARIIGRLRL